MSDSLDPVLLHVRKAYRLLNAYHERVLSSIGKIGDFFGKEFHAWCSDFYYKGNKFNKEVFNRHLDLNPLQHATFLFTPVGKLPMAGEWLLDITHVGDSAFYTEDYDPASLPEADKAATEIGLYAFLVIEGGGGDWYGVWNNSRYPGEEQDVRIAGEEVWQGTSSGCTVWAFGSSWSVADFANEALLSSRCTQFQALVDRIVSESERRR